MKKFLIGLAAGFVLAGLAVIVTGFAMLRLGDRKPAIAEGSTLVLRLQGEIVEVSRTEIPIPLFESRSPLTTIEVWDLLRKAAADSRIKAVALEPAGLQAGWGKLDEIRQAVLRFRKSGKPVYCFLRTPGTREYYLATAADKIFLAPEDMLYVKGLRAELMYYKGGLDKLGVQVEVENTGPHKDALDPFVRSSASPETRATVDAILGQVHSSFLAAVAEGRRKPVEEIARLIDSGPHLAAQAKSAGLVDALAFEDEYLDALKTNLKQSELKRLSYRDYLKVPAASLGLEGKTRVAVISGQGAILRGGDPSGMEDEDAIFSAPFNRMLRKVAEDAQIKGVILRVDSPGGDAIASDEILHEVKKLSSKKPVVISMADVAASGGYYIAMSGDPVLAYPNTITGSIGVIFGKANLQKLYEKLGVNVEMITRGKNAAIDTAARPLDEAGRQKLREGVQATYRSFLQHVSAGRKKKVEEIEPLAGGRVWMGQAAKERALVDELGGLERAIELMKQRLKLDAAEKLQIVVYPQRRSFLEQWFGQRPEVLSGESEARAEAWIEARVARRIRELTPGLDWRVFEQGAALRLMPFSVRVE
jgi:protease-4